MLSPVLLLALSAAISTSAVDAAPAGSGVAALAQSASSTPEPSASPAPRRSLLDLLRKARPAQGLGEADIVAGLKQALELGAASATKSLGRPDGFLGNERVKIPVPEKLQPVESGLRRLKQSRIADQFVESLNRAAERAVPAALSILGDAVKSMSIKDAKGILTGAPDSATVYLKRTSDPSLRQAFLPIVSRATAETGVAAAYKNLLGRAGPLARLAGAEGQDLDGYVTAKALDGLYLLIADEEKKIREDPKARATDLLRRVFGR